MGASLQCPSSICRGFQRGSRYLPDRRDLNRYFPGVSKGSLASRIALPFPQRTVILRLADRRAHGFTETHQPAAGRADMRVPKIAKFTEGFDDMVVVHVGGGVGMLRWAFVKKAYRRSRWRWANPCASTEYQIKAGVHGINGCSTSGDIQDPSFGATRNRSTINRPGSERRQAAFCSVRWIWMTTSKGKQLGVVIDPITNETTPILSPH